MKSRKPFLCLSCGIDTGKAHEYYSLKDEIWFKIHNSKIGMFCILCAEQRLGRQLVRADFTDTWINHGAFPMSDRLRSRMAA